MFITNIKGNESTVLLDREIGEYLETHGVPLLGFDGNKYVFSDTELLKSKLKTLPAILKIKFMLKGGGRI
jgi:pseudouridine-5'-phosphate glycosidase